MFSFIDHKVKVWLKDGAIIEGILLKTDESGNLLLNDAIEKYKKSENRYLGLIVLRGATINNITSLFKVPQRNFVL